MKKQVTVEQNFCDVCGAPTNGYNNCIACGRNYCFDCATKYLILYQHGVHFGGSGDSNYCRDCDSKLSSTGTNALWLAYKTIQNLRLEEKSIYDNFETRANKAEAWLQELLRREKENHENR
jgi:hypothetical protein